MSKEAHQDEVEVPVQNLSPAEAESAILGNENIENGAGQRCAIGCCNLLMCLLFPFTVCCMFKTIDQTHRGVIFRFGKLKKKEAVEPGLHIINPLIDEIVEVDVRRILVDIPPQNILTTEMVSLKIDGTFSYQIIDPVLSVTRVQNIQYSIANYVMIELRNILAAHSMREILAAKQKLSESLMKRLKPAIQVWGAQLEKVEIQNIQLPDDMQRSMAVEAEAQREANAKLVAAEGEKNAAIVLAEAARTLGSDPNALYLRSLQTLNAIASEGKSQTIIFPMEMMKFANGMMQIQQQN